MNSLNGRLLEISKLEKYELYPPFPKKNLLIEVTNKCNSNCIFCANSKMKRKRKYIDSQVPLLQMLIHGVYHPSSVIPRPISILR